MALQLNKKTRYYLEQLELLASQDEKSLEIVLERIVSHYFDFFPSQNLEGTSGDQLLTLADEVQFTGGGADMSSHIREILETEYGDYLESRLHRDED